MSILSKQIGIKLAFGGHILAFCMNMFLSSQKFVFCVHKLQFISILCPQMRIFGHKLLLCVHKFALCGHKLVFCVHNLWTQIYILWAQVGIFTTLGGRK